MEKVRRLMNEEIFHVVQENTKMLETLWRSKHTPLGHVLRHSGMLCDLFGKKTRTRRKMDTDVRRLDRK